MVVLGILGGQEIIVILIIVLVLFGGRKVPELMRGLGRGIREFKDGAEGIVNDQSSRRDNASSTKS